MVRNYKRVLPLREKILGSIGAPRQLLEEILSVFIGGCALFMLLAVVSYRGMNSEGIPLVNGLMGMAGGYLSYSLFVLIGCSSYALPLIMGLSSVLIFIRKKEYLGPVRLLLTFIMLLLLAAGFDVMLGGREILGGHAAGGIVGSRLGGLLLPVFARAGSVLLLGTCILILVILTSGLSMRKCLGLLWSVVRHAARAAGAVAKRLAELISGLRDAMAREQPEPVEDEEYEEPEEAIEEETPREEEARIILSMLPATKKKAGRKCARSARLSSFKLPPYDLLNAADEKENLVSKDHLKETEEKLIDTLKSFKINGVVTAIQIGPVVTTYEFRPEKGTKIANITSRQDDITMSLEALKVRIVAPIPGKNAVGFEIPNRDRMNVLLSEMVHDGNFDRQRRRIPLALGKDIAGKPYVGDLDKMPHLLIAGTTGSGKSVCINTLIMSLLYNFTPNELKMILIDPKQVEMQSYAGIPHLLLPVVTDPKKAAVALKWAIDEMEMRYHLFASIGSRDIRSYNKRIVDEAGDKHARKKEIEDAPGDGGKGTLHAPDEPMPYIVIVIEEFADLMMAAAREAEVTVIRLAQKARAAGIHLIIATQRPDVNVVTGLIKANFPCRLAFRVASKVDSRVMFDKMGAETLLGNGDMLFLPPGTSDLHRIQGAFVSEEEIRRVADFLKEQETATYREEEILSGSLEDDIPLQDDEDSDEHYEAAINLVMSERKASVSYLQRRFRIGYNRAARIVEKMERDGIVGPQVPGKAYREVLPPAPP